MLSRRRNFASQNSGANIKAPLETIGGQDCRAWVFMGAGKYLTAGETARRYFYE
jgi:hypothetical protein